MVQERLCLACSKPFEVPASSKRKYCSKSCWPAPGNHSRKALPDVRLDCAHCGQTFIRKGWLAKKQTGRGQKSYCSTTCRDAAKRGRKGEQRVARLTIECVACGKSFKVPPHQRHRKTCSHQCAGRIGGRRGEKSTRFHSGGYVYVYLPPDERPAGHEHKSHQAEHRVVMAQILGRWPEPYETVHHINGDKTDNRPENLQLRSGRHGKDGILRCRSCGSNDIEHVEL